MSTYVIGDIHGEFNQLLELLNTMDFSSKDWLYVMGDVVDKGEHPIKSLQLLMGLPNCTCLMGNHELMMLKNRGMINNLDNLSTEFIENNCFDILDWLNNGAESTLCELSELSLDERIEYMQNELEAGSSLIIVEAREGGKNIGIYDKAGNAKEDEIDYILDNFDGNKILWEAPNKDQQVFFILKLGNDVNLGNVSTDDITSLETLRRGLRGDTVGKI